MKTSPMQFLRQVRQEISKISWPSRQETIMSTLMVIVLCFIVSLFFFMVDGSISWLVRLILVDKGIV